LLADSALATRHSGFTTVDVDRDRALAAVFGWRQVCKSFEPPAFVDGTGTNFPDDAIHDLAERRHCPSSRGSLDQ